MNIFLQLFLTFFEIGLVSFGGGYGMIPLIREKCLTLGWLAESEIINFIAVSESTPGPIAVNMATFVGSSQGGFLGALLATIGVVLPAFIIMLIIVTVLKNVFKLLGVKWAINGIKPVIIGMVIATSITIMLSVAFGMTKIGDAVQFDYKSVVIFAIIAIISLLYKKLFKKAPSPILLILISAPLGLIFYGLL